MIYKRRCGWHKDVFILFKRFNDQRLRQWNSILRNLNSSWPLHGREKRNQKYNFKVLNMNTTIVSSREHLSLFLSFSPSLPLSFSLTLSPPFSLLSLSLSPPLSPSLHLSLSLYFTLSISLSISLSLSLSLSLHLSTSLTLLSLSLSLFHILDQNPYSSPETKCGSPTIPKKGKSWPRRRMSFLLSSSASSSSQKLIFPRLSILHGLWMDGTLNERKVSKKKYSEHEVTYHAH